MSIATIGVPAALLALAASWLIWTTGALWRWMAVLGLVAGGLHALALFVVACSLNMLLGRGAATPHPLAAASGTMPA